MDDSDMDDYLQDPEMWGARLPQPYRMIDKILKDILEEAWARIEERQVQALREAARVKVPEGTSGRVVCEEVLTECRGGVCAGRELVVVGNGNSICVVQYAPLEDEEGEEMEGVEEIVAQYKLQHEVTKVVVAQRDVVDLIFAQHDTEVKILGYLWNAFIEIVEIPCQKDATIKDITVSSDCSHVGVVHGSKLSLYICPMESWLCELPINPPGSDVSIASRKDVVYSKPALLYTLSAPVPPPPSSAIHPYNVFQSVCDQAGAVVPTGELHSLTSLYFENRRRAYASRRQPFVPMTHPSIDTGSQKDVHLTCHFICHKHGAACEVAVWWEGHHYLTTYPLKEPDVKSNTVPPTRQIPQASPIVCSCISEDSTVLALGLNTGVVVVWNIKIDLCNRVVPCVPPPDVISVLRFFRCTAGTGGGMMLAIGTDRGKVLVLDTAIGGTKPAIAFNSRPKKQQEVSNMFTSSGYDIQSKVVCIKLNPHLPSFLVSVHGNGALVVWNVPQQEPVCKYALNKHWSLFSSPTSNSCAMTSHFLFVTGSVAEAETKSYNVMCFDLASMEFLESYWESSSNESSSTISCHREAESTEHYALLDTAEAHLKDYMKARLPKMDEDLIKWQECWKDLPNRLTEQ